MPILQDGHAYVLGRILGTASRPAALFIANSWFAAAVAQDVAVALLTTSLGMAASGVPVHRLFYPSWFSEESRRDYSRFDLYAGGVFLSTIVGAVFVLVFSFRLGGNWPFAVVLLAYFMSEKLQDEVLRYRLFANSFGRWGRSVGGRTLIQFGLLGSLYSLFGPGFGGTTAVGALALGNLVVFVPQVPYRVYDELRRLDAQQLADLFRRSVRDLMDLREFWLLMVAVKATAYLDRLIAIAVPRSELPVFLLVVMCFSVIGLTVDFFYISRRRREFLDNKISVLQGFLDKAFLGSLLLGLILGGGACGLVLISSAGGSTMSLTIVVSIAVLQVGNAAANVPFEISYWIHSARALLTVEAIFWILFGAALGLSLVFSLSTIEILQLAAGAAWARLALHILLASRGGRSGVSVGRAAGGNHF